MNDSSLRTLNTPSNPGVSQTHGSDKVMLNRTTGFPVVGIPTPAGYRRWPCYDSD